VLAAEAFAAGHSVLMLNADNLYPTAALAELRRLPRAGLLGFRRSGLVRSGNFPAERINAFALIAREPAHELSRIVEKPGPAEAEGSGRSPGQHERLAAAAHHLRPPAGPSRRRRAASWSSRMPCGTPSSGSASASRHRIGGPCTGSLFPEDIASVTARLQGSRQPMIGGWRRRWWAVA
jgi:hypothetical protein